MNKPVNRVIEARNDSSATASKISRAITDISRQLDDHRARAQNVRDLFRENVEILRVKLRDYCDKLMFMDSVNYGKKAEDLLWKKSFYEVVTTVKHLNRKKGGLDDCERSLVYFHLESGIGHYHHLIMKLQTYFKLDLRGSVDFPLLVADRGLKKDSSWNANKAIELGGLEWSQQALVRCLIYLGDLSRYLNEFHPTGTRSLAQRYYAQALNLNPDCGIPHNQLGTMSSSLNYGLDSAYYYMRSILCKERFEGTEANFHSLFESNTENLQKLKKFDHSDENVPQLKNLLLSFLQITYNLFYDKQFPQNEMLNKVMKELEAGFSSMNSSANGISGEGETESPVHLNDYMIFKMVVMLIMCVQRLKAKGSNQTWVGMRLCVYMACLCIERCVHVLGSVLGPPRQRPSNSRQHRRRRPRRSSFNAPTSDSDESVSAYSSGSDPGEEDLVFDLCNKSDDEGVNNDEEEVKLFRRDGRGDESHPANLLPWTHPLVTSNKYFLQIHKISKSDCILQTLKVIFDWFANVNFMMKPNGVISSTSSLIANFISLMNYLTAVPSLKQLKDHIDENVVTEEWVISTPLPEDINLKGLESMKSAHSLLNWNQFKTQNMEPKLETYVRILKLVKFGIELSKRTESPICYNESKEWFTSQQQPLSPLKNGAHKEEGKENEALMKNLAEMWLKSEVTELEKKTKRGELPAYLVLDTAAFLYYTPLIKNLVQAKLFVLIVPTTVVSALDYEKQKGNNRGVRETMRWIEHQVRDGSRFLRNQRTNEHTPIPLIKYPKKKDKDACSFIQVVECAYYLSNQSSGEKNSGLVTLLTGNPSLIAKQNGFSAVGVAKTAGVNVEFIETFYGKWKASSKSHG